MCLTLTPNLATGSLLPVKPESRTFGSRRGEDEGLEGSATKSKVFRMPGLGGELGARTRTEVPHGTSETEQRVGRLRIAHQGVGTYRTPQRHGQTGPRWGSGGLCPPGYSTCSV